MGERGSCICICHVKIIWEFGEHKRGVGVAPGFHKKCLPVFRDKKNFQPGKLIFILTCSMGKGSGKTSANVIKKSKLKLAKGKQNWRATCNCPNGKLEFKVCSSPVLEAQMRATLHL